jgi:hypothetical protein
LAIIGNHWQSLAIIGNHWQSLAIIGNHWQSLAIIGNDLCHNDLDINLNRAILDDTFLKLPLHTYTCGIVSRGPFVGTYIGNSSLLGRVFKRMARCELFCKGENFSVGSEIRMKTPLGRRRFH